MIKRPMKAPGEGVTLDDLKAMQYPIACSAKLDGIRAIITPSGVLSNTLKPLGNLYMQSCLNDPALIGLDGELIVGLPYADPNDPDDDVFNRTTGAIRRSSGEPDFKFYVFDRFINKEDNYDSRWVSQAFPEITNPHVLFLTQRICYSIEEALEYERELIITGYEGMMARTLTAPYKEGRVTMNEGYILKRKPLEQDEATIIGAYEQMQNLNEKVTNELGRGQRSSHKENKVGKDTLGGFTMSSPKWKEPFNCGTIIGGTDEWRKQIWEQYKADPQSVLGQLGTYVYQGYGSIDKPRQPRMKAEFRSPDDMTSY